MFPQMSIDNYLKLLQDEKFHTVDVRLCPDCIEFYAVCSPHSGLPVKPAAVYTPSSSRASPFGCHHSTLASTIPLGSPASSPARTVNLGETSNTMLLTDLNDSPAPTRLAHNRPKSGGVRRKQSASGTQVSRPQSAPPYRQVSHRPMSPAKRALSKHTGVKLGVRPAKGLSSVGHTNKPVCNAVWGASQRSPTKEDRLGKLVPKVEPEPEAMVAAKLKSCSTDPRSGANGIVEAALEYHMSLVEMRHKQKLPPEQLEQPQHVFSAASDSTQRRQRPIPKMEGLTSQHASLIGRALEYQRSLRPPPPAVSGRTHPALSVRELQVVAEARGDQKVTGQMYQAAFNGLPQQPLRQVKQAADVMSPTAFSAKQQQQVLMRIQQLTGSRLN